MESEAARDSMNRVHRLLTVAKCLAAKGVDKDDNPEWIADTFAMLIDLIEEEIDQAAAKIDCAAKSEAQTIDHRPAA